VVHEEIADELEEEFMEDDRISSNQQALQEVETDLEALKTVVMKMLVECRLDY